MKNLFFLALVLLGLGLSSCQEDREGYLEISNIKLLNYNEFDKSYYGYYGQFSWVNWDPELPGKAEEKYPDIFARVYFRYSSRRVDTIVKETRVLHNCPHGQEVYLPLQKMSFPDDTEATVSILLVDHDEDNYHRGMHSFRFTPAGLKRDQIETAYITSDENGVLRFDVSYH
ncbi:hypothetical protein [Saprospira grandis]|uniref:hypothetical protein n=1 Tax=Saprospira grandis TaxID=1008 RepID=UPI0022DE259F|nr:hypothetical protein [Saprospira grandis]WBM75355.1 hypothetical protein OP864_03730 [Saprospira grandis]